MEQEGNYGFLMIQAEEISEIIHRERCLILDLRSEESFLEGHIGHSRNVPFELMGEWIDALPQRVSLILYCEHGNQSLLAARKLRGRRGTIYTLSGGYQAYLNMKKD